ncbi:hypothetical protein XENOCAPTIV_030468 [Xenoophorus captivus]|uniref:Uncharacterized protein n=1 Tax=Xenoophorus captivus TaxID=1517983 RepID=A0ABV0R2T6_9TELE
MLNIQRPVSAYLKPLCLFSFYFRHQQDISIHTAAAPWIFSPFWIIFCKPEEWLCMKIPADPVVSEKLRPPYLAQKPSYIEWIYGAFTPNLWNTVPCQSPVIGAHHANVNPSWTREPYPAMFTTAGLGMIYPDPGAVRL